MGFDVYGLNPINKLNVERPIFPEGFSDLSEEAKEAYWIELDAYEKAVPGNYWRSNVWWWRTLWAYTCEVCQDVMTVKHMDAGADNSGNTVPKTTAVKMVRKLKKAEKNKYHEEYEKNHTKWMNQLPEENCHCCDGTGLRNDKLGREARKEDPNYTCNGCRGKGTTKSFMANYPFKAEVAVQFRKFIEESGGFQVC